MRNQNLFEEFYESTNFCMWDFGRLQSSFYPMKLTTTRWSTMWAKMKSANPLSGEIPTNCNLFSGFDWSRRHTENVKIQKIKKMSKFAKTCEFYQPKQSSWHRRWIQRGMNWRGRFQLARNRQIALSQWAKCKQDRHRWFSTSSVCCFDIHYRTSVELMTIEPFLLISLTFLYF